jgi:hypothetical protein
VCVTALSLIELAIKISAGGVQNELKVNYTHSTDNML